MVSSSFSNLVRPRASVLLKDSSSVLRVFLMFFARAFTSGKVDANWQTRVSTSSGRKHFSPMKPSVRP